MRSPGRSCSGTPPERPLATRRATSGSPMAGPAALLGYGRGTDYLQLTGARRTARRTEAVVDRPGVTRANPASHRNPPPRRRPRHLGDGHRGLLDRAHGGDLRVDPLDGVDVGRPVRG